MTTLKKSLKKMVSLALVSASALGLTGCSDQHQSEEELAQKEIRQVAQDLEKQIRNGFTSPEAFNNLAVSCATGADTVEGYSMAKDLSVNEQKAFATCISQTSRDFSEKLRPYIIKDNKKMARDVLPQIPPANIAAFKNTLKDGISSTEPGGNLPFPVDHYKRNFHLFSSHTMVSCKSLGLAWRIKPLGKLTCFIRRYGEEHFHLWDKPKRSPQNRSPKIPHRYSRYMATCEIFKSF